MSKLTEEISLVLRWPQRPEDTKVLAAKDAELPLKAEAVVGSYAVKADASYEVLLQCGRRSILHAAGRLPDGNQSSSSTAEAWIRCEVDEVGECSYEVHVGPAGMGPAKAYHKGRISLGVK